MKRREGSTGSTVDLSLGQNHKPIFFTLGLLLVVQIPSTPSLRYFLGGNIVAEHHHCKEGYEAGTVQSTFKGAKIK